MNSAPIKRMLLKLCTKCCHDIDGKIIYTVIIISVFGIIPFGHKIHRNAVFVTNWLYLCKFNCRKAIRSDRKACYAKSHQTLYFCIMQSHLACFISILIVHKMNDVIGIRIKLGIVFQHFLIAFPNLIIIEDFVRHRLNSRYNQRSFFLIDSAVNRIEQRLGKIAARTEKLHLFSHTHSGNTACNSIVVSVDWTHNIVIFILN